MPKISTGVKVNPLDLIRRSTDRTSRFSENKGLRLAPQVFYGPRRVGKTVLAATASEDWQGAKDEEYDLNDILYIAVDEGALDALIQFNVVIPNTILFSDLVATSNGNNLTALNLLKEAVPDIIASTKTNIMVIDTISQLDWSIQQNIGGDTTQDFYRMLLTHHKMFNSFLCNVDQTVISLVHAKPVGEARSNKPEEIKKTKVQQAAKYYLPPEIEPAITGQALNIYLSNTSLHGALLSRKLPGPKGEIERKVYFGSNSAGFEASSRFEGMLNPEGEEPNLRDIWKKIRYI